MSEFDWGAPQQSPYTAEYKFIHHLPTGYMDFQPYPPSGFLSHDQMIDQYYGGNQDWSWNDWATGYANLSRSASGQLRPNFRMYQDSPELEAYAQRRLQEAHPEADWGQARYASEGLQKATGATLRVGVGGAGLRTADYQGMTNWATWNVNLWIENEAETQQIAQEFVKRGDKQGLIDWAMQNYIVPHNRDAMLDAQEWNDMPREERIDYELEDMKNRHPEHQELFDNMFGQGDVDDVTPNLIDPEIINWDEIVQSIQNDLDENAEWERSEQKKQELGIDFMHQHGSDPDEPKNRMYDAWMRYHGALTDDEIKAQGGKPWDHPQSESRLMMWNPLEAIQQGGSEYHWPKGFGQQHIDEIQQNGGWNERASAIGRQAVIDALYGRPNPYHPLLREALQKRGYTPEQIEQFMQQRYQLVDDPRYPGQQKVVDMQAQPPKPDPTLDQPGDLTIPNEWLSKLAADDWAPLPMDYFKTRRPFYVDLTNPQNPNPEIWIGNPAETHPYPLPQPYYVKGEIWEDTNPPRFTTYHGTDPELSNTAIAHAQRAYFQMKDDPSKREASENWKQKYHYRAAGKDAKRTCATCSAFIGGKCHMFYLSNVESEMVCDEWSSVWEPKTSSDGADYWTQSQDDWTGPQSVDLFNIDAPGKAPGMGDPNDPAAHSDFRSPCWCDVGPTTPHEWSGSCENGLHPTLPHEASFNNEPDVVPSGWAHTPTKMPPLGWGDGQWDDDTFLDHNLINEQLGEQQQAEQYRQFQERSKRRTDAQWPEIGIKEAADLVPGNEGHWAWLDGHTAFGGDHHDLVRQLAQNIGYDPTKINYLSNMVARNFLPEDHAIAVGTMNGGYPQIMMSTRDRNAIWDDVMRAHEESKIPEMSKVAMAEKSGDPDLDVLIEKFMDDNWGYLEDYQLGDVARGNCADVSEFFAKWMRDHGVDAEIHDITDTALPGDPASTFEGAGYGDAQYRDPEGGWHATVEIHMPSGTYMVDFTAAQYGYEEFPMVQRLDDQGQWQRKWAKTAEYDWANPKPQTDYYKWGYNPKHGVLVWPLHGNNSDGDVEDMRAGHSHIDYMNRNWSRFHDDGSNRYPFFKGDVMGTIYHDPETNQATVMQFPREAGTQINPKVFPIVEQAFRRYAPDAEMVWPTNAAYS